MTLDRDGPDDSALVGRIVAGALRVTERAGSTPQGPVYQAEYLDGRPVLMLVLPSRVPGQEPPAARYFRLATRIRHPNVAAVRAVGDLEDGSAYVILEQLDGEPVLHRLTEESSLPLGEALDLAIQAAAGLEAVHQAGFIHGNVSPSTILVTRAPYGKSQVKLVGFSMDPDRERENRLEAASLDYASPERLDGVPPDERCDVFSLGAVLHHFLSGSPPDASGAVAQVPKITRRVLEKAVAPAAAARYQTMSEFREALEQLAGVVASPAQTAGHRALVRAVAGGLVLVAGGLVLVAAWRNVESSRSEAASFAAATEPARVTVRSSPIRKAPSAPTRSSAPAASGAAPRESGAAPRPPGEAPRASAAAPRKSGAAPTMTGTAPTNSEARRAPVRPSSEPGKAAVASGRSTAADGIAKESRAPTGAPDRAAVVASRDGRLERRAEAPEAAGYVGETLRRPIRADTAEARAPPRPRRPSPPAPAPPKADPARTRAVLEQHPGLRLAMGDITRIGLAENVVEVRPGVLVLHLAAAGMGVPSAHYNLQRLYLAYSAATPEADTVALELRRNGQPIGWFGRQGLRYASSDADR